MNIKLIVLLVLMIVSGVAGFFGIPAMLHLQEALRAQPLAFLVIGVDVAMAVPAAATIWFLLSSQHALTATTRVAYRIIAAGVFFYSLTLLAQLALVIVLIRFPSISIGSVATSIIFAVPFILSTLELYIGVRLLTRQLGIRLKWMSIWVILASAAAVALASALIPHTPSPDPKDELITKILFGAVAWAGVFAAFATAGAIRIKNTIISSYHGAMAWLALALAATTFAILHEIVFRDTNLSSSSYSIHGFVLWPYLLAAILFMKAGQVFKEATFKKLPEQATYVDAVTYAAALVTDVRAIDITLDKLRQITANVKPGETPNLTADDKKTLLGVYRTIEDYLVTKEPLRQVTRQALRARLPADIQADLSES